MKINAPRPDEYPPTVEAYIQEMRGIDIAYALSSQSGELVALTQRCSPEKETFAYAAGKWTIRQVVGHLIDAERVFGYRAMSFARGETTPLPAFDEDQYAAKSGHNECSLRSLSEEFCNLRQSHIHMFSHLPAGAFDNVGSANYKQISVRALASVMVGHVQHHIKVLAEHYGLSDFPLRDSANA